MTYNTTQTFLHTNRDTARNFVNGFKKFHLRFFSKYTYQHLPLDDLDLSTKSTGKKSRLPTRFLLNIPKLDLSDKRPVSLYKNNFEPQALKDVGKIIGTKETYSYIIRETASMLSQELIPELISYSADKMAIKAEKMMVPADPRSPIGPNNHYFAVQAFNQFFNKPIEKFSQFLSERMINGPTKDIDIKHIIKATIGSEKFLPLYLHDYAQSENRMLENNIFSILKSYSSTIAKTISLALHATYIYKMYKFFPGAKLTFKIGSILVGLKALYEIITKKIFVKIGEEDRYKTFASEINLDQDQYNVKATVFTPSIGHLNDREILRDKYNLQLIEEKLWLHGLDTIMDIDAIQRTIISCYSAINFADATLRNGATWFEFRTDFNRLNNIFFNSVKTVSTLITSNPSFALQAKQVNKIVKAIDSYTENNIQNNQIYQNNNSTKLIISNLKADVIETNKTIVDFSDYSLAIDISSGKHYLMEGQNSVGKSLILKLLSGYSGGLAVQGSVSYPAGFDRNDMYYSSQDDYIAVFKPILHRLAVPRLLPADVMTKESIAENEAMSEQEFNRFVDFMAILLFRMKYDAQWRSIEDAKEFLLKNYNDYIELINEGSEAAWTKLVETQNNLTGGQIKKQGFANAIYRGVKFLILDESFNAIDQPTKLESYKIINEFAPDAAVLVLQHQIADNLIKLTQDKEKVAEILSSLEETKDANKSNHNEKIDQIADKVRYFRESLLEEELEFFDAVITMSRNQTEDNKAMTLFNTTNLHNNNETLVEFYRNEPVVDLEKDNNYVTFIEVKILGDQVIAY